MALKCDLALGQETNIVSRVLQARPTSLVESASVALEDIQLRNAIHSYILELNEDAEEHDEPPIPPLVESALVQLAEYAATCSRQIPSPGVFGRSNGSGLLVYHNLHSRRRLSIEIPPDASHYRVVWVDEERAAEPVLLPVNPKSLRPLFAWVALTPTP